MQKGELEFPAWGLVPKKETGVLSFLMKYPEYDGRGITIAVFDSGIDPGAPGLQRTSEGKQKLLHRFDCSGCGDVTTSTVVHPVDGVITGLTGRKLKIPNTWVNPSNNYRIGVKHAYDLYPKRLQERIAAEYKEKKWDAPFRTCIADASREVINFEMRHVLSNMSEPDKLTKEDIDSKYEILGNCDKKFHDSGPVYDCLLFHNGRHWQCCVDTTEQGNLSECPVLGEYSVTYDFAPLTASDSLNFSMNVHNSGNVLELVGLCSSHGTHVASIASGYFPDYPEQNGAAPGSQLISFTIGDGRLGSMETGTALVRAIIKLMELTKTEPIHVINMSYGEHAHFSDAGRIGELMNEVVNKYGVVWVASAGNHGPALSTIGTPPDISQDTIIGVGAYVSPDMMIAAYSMYQQLPGMPFTWSSRDPCIDGGTGVTVCAPGGAVTSVPNFTLRGSQLMNGTSMAAPHVAGGISIILSGLLKKKLKYSPYSVKRALENTAFFLRDVESFAQGSGLFQVDKCFDQLVTYHDCQESNVRFHVACGNGQSAKGIYIRSTVAKSSYNYSVSIEPFFLDSDNVEPSVKISFNMKLVLVCTADYVNCPTHLDLSNGARVFAVKVSVASLLVGAHSTVIEAFDVTCPEKGAVFKIPITVIQPQEVSSPRHTAQFSGVVFKPNSIKRHFFVVPHFATWAVVRLACKGDVASGAIGGRFVVHTMHILPKQSCKTLECNKSVTVNSNVDSLVNFQVRSDVVLEVVIAKYWANLGEQNVDYSVTFYGVKPNEQSITMHAASGISSVEVTSLQGEEIAPSINFKGSVQVLKTSEGKISPLGMRDVIPPNRQIYELLLVYHFNLTKTTEVSPNLAILSDVLYESEFESQLWQLYDSNKQLMGCGDAYPSKYSIKLDKGDYVIRLHVRHERRDYLEKLSDTPLLLVQKLTSNITMEVYSSYCQALISGRKAIASHGLHSTTVPLYMAPLASDKFATKSNNPAHFLIGNVTYCKDELGKAVDFYPIKYIFCEGGSQYKKLTVNGSSSSSSVNSINFDKSKYDEMKDAVRDLKTSMLGKAGDIGVADKMYEEFTAEYPEHIQLHTAYLQVLDPLDVKRAFPPMNTRAMNVNEIVQNKIISICDKAMEGINLQALLAHVAMKTDLRPDAPLIKISMDQQKNVFIECMCRKGIALCRLLTEENKVDTINSLATIWRTLLKFFEPADNKAIYVCYFILWHARVHKQYGRMLKYALKLQEERPSKDLEEKIVELFRVNKWHFLADHTLRNLPSKFPSAYRPF